jgi:hypothetical protein
MVAPLAQRIKGQETTILFVRGGVLEEELTDTVDFEFEPKLELKEQGYLGEFTNRHDEIFNGVKFTGTIHLHSNLWFRFQSAIVARAQRLQPDLVFNISTVFSFPNGTSEIVLIPDAKFGAQPLSIKSRGDYVSVKLEGAADEYIPTAA